MMALEDGEPPSPMHNLGVVAIATGIAAIVLLALHPEPAVRDFSSLLKSEAASRGLDGIVHGGYIVVLALQMVCYAVFSRHIIRHRTLGLAAIVSFAIGVAFFSAALVLDGLAAPALAARYAPHPEKLEFARSLFIFIGILVGVLQPLGLAFQAAAIALWGWALAGQGARIAGGFAMLLGFALLLAAAAAVAFANPLPIMGAILGTVAWAIGVGMAMRRA